TRGLTLAQLSQKSGVSLSYVSAVEKGVNLPSLQTLVRITDALGATIRSVLADEGQNQAQQSRLPDHPGSVTASHPQLQLRVEFLRAEAGAAGQAPVPVQGRDLFCYVVSGQINVDIDGERYELGPGDALDATAPARVSWRTGPGCLATWVSCPSRSA
ncbi:MAG TPA: helix-turn-helix domain-containing protein, partial [Micromonosporaceae bacterium]